MNQSIPRCLALLALAVALTSAETAPAPLDQKAVAAQIRTAVGAPVRFAWIRSVDGRCDYLGPAFKTRENDNFWVVMVFDTEEGKERVFAPAATAGANNWPMITPSGRQLVWSRGRKEVLIADWDGRNARTFGPGIMALGVAEDPPGTEWVYICENQDEDGNGKVVNRYRIDKPAVKQLVWDKTPSGAFFDMTRDGRWVVTGTPGQGVSLADLPNGAFKQFGQGCNHALCPDGSGLAFHMLGGHYGIQMYDKDRKSWFIPFDDAPGRNNQKVEWWGPRWLKYDARFIAMTGPWAGPPRAKGKVILGEFNEDYHGMKQWILVTDNQESETHVYAWKMTDQAPRLVKQPESQSVAEGETATFAVQAEGSPAPTFQWLQNGKEIPGATTSSYSVAASRTVKDAQFCCVIKSPLGTVKSQVAKLDVKLKGPTPEVFAQWDVKLQARLREALKGGKKIPLSPNDTKNPRPVTAVDDKGNLRVELGKGAEGGQPWSKLALEDKLTLALATCRDKEPADQALAGFYLLALGKDADAAVHLGKAGKEADAVRACFK